MALKGAGKRPSTCFTSVAGTVQQRLITERQDSDKTRRRSERKFGGFLDINETIQVQMAVGPHKTYREVMSEL